MATLNLLAPKTKRARRQRVGRGGKRGTFSGRGIKGQKSRSGRKMRPELRDIIKKIPKLRGYGVPRYRTTPETVTITSLERVFATGATIGIRELTEANLVHARRAKGRTVKVLGGGKLTKVFHLQDVSVTAGVRATITKAGGTITEKVAKQANPSKTKNKKPSLSRGAKQAAAKKAAPAKKASAKKTPAKKASATKVAKKSK